jgi:acyl-CoA dehydrogenase
MLRGVARTQGIEAISVFLDGQHVELASRLTHFCSTTLATRPEPATDHEARREATTLLHSLGDEGLFEWPDLRALCLTRDAVASASPLADAVVAIQALGAVPLMTAGSMAQREQWLGAIMSGRAMAAFAMSEPEAGSDPASMQTTAKRNGDGWTIGGEKHLISNAGIADVYLVFAVTKAGAGSRGISAFIVPADTPGVVFKGAQVLAAPHPLGRLSFEECRVPAAALLGEEHRGFKLGMQTLDFVRPSVGAAACGMSARALIEALQHASTRKQFGDTLSSFQLVREKLGRMATDLEAARLLVYRAAWHRDHHATIEPGASVPKETRFTVEAAMAKSFATEVAQHVVDEAVQILGGPGVLVGHPVERLYRSVRALRIYEGTTEIQRLLVAGELLKEA